MVHDPVGTDSKGGQRFCIVLVSLFLVGWLYYQWRHPVNWSRSGSGGISIWEDAARKSPLKPRPHMNLGAAYLDARRLDEAITEFHNAIRLVESRSPSERAYVVPRAAANIGSALSKQGKHAEAESALSKAWTEFPGHPGIGVNLASALLTEARRRLQAAVGVTTEAIAAQRTQYRSFEAPGYLYWNRATALYMLGECARAQQDFYTAQKLDADLAALTVPVCAPQIKEK